MKPWIAHEIAVKDHEGAMVSVKEFDSGGGHTRVEVSGHVQTIGPDCAISLAAWLIARVAQHKGVPVHDVQITVKKK